jgi:hypothetical protein
MVHQISGRVTREAATPSMPASAANPPPIRA